MPNSPHPDGHVIYQIRIKGHLGHEWTDWFEGMVITAESNDETLLSGAVEDQSALFGLLKKVRDLGTPLISVISIAPGQTDEPESKP